MILKGGSGEVWMEVVVANFKVYIFPSAEIAQSI
jgi:hypothetical protein